MAVIDGDTVPDIWLPNQHMRERARVPSTTVKDLNRHDDLDLDAP